MNFATLQGLTIPEGVVTQITDASGRVIWSAVKSVPVVLQVEKITSNTYAGETTYNNEQFILLDIYPKTNGTVKVTYGGLTKTITDTSGAEEPNAQQVFFGTFNGVSDSVTTPASGELTIEGGYKSFTCATYASSSKSPTASCPCITAVNEWGDLKYIADSAFNNCTSLALTALPNSITSIGSSAFNGCTALALTSLPNSLTSIGEYAFNGCTALALTSLPNSLTSIGNSAFSGCTSLALTSLPNSITSIGNSAFNNCTSLALTALPNSITSIGSSAFNRCIGINSVVIPNNCTVISGYAFYHCDNIKSVVIPDSVIEIGENAFYLSSKTYEYSCSVGSGVTSIGSAALYNNDGTVTILATTPPTAGSNVVGGQGAATRTTVIVPKGCSSAYKAADVWSSYNIVEAS